MDFAQHIKVRREKFGAVIFDTLREKVFVTNETGLNILKLIEEGKTGSEIVTILNEEYRGGAEDVDKDITAFIDELRANNVLA